MLTHKSVPLLLTLWPFTSGFPPFYHWSCRFINHLIFFIGSL